MADNIPILDHGAVSPANITNPVAGQVLEYNGTYWVNAYSGAASIIWQGTSPPGTPAQYPYWLNTTTGGLYLYYTSGVGNSQWIEVSSV